MSFPAYDEYKDSGESWLGIIPSHWQLSAVRYAFENLDFKRVPLSGEHRSDIEKIYPYYGASGIIDYVDNYIFDEPLILVAEDGANLLSRSTPLAFIATGKYWVNNHAHILRPIEGDLKFFECLLQVYDYTPIVTGAAQPKLTAEQLAGIRLPNPPLDEQKAISSFLDVETSKIDGLVSEQRRLIELLKEKRQAVISHAVTKGLPAAAARQAGLNPNAPMKPSGIQWLGDVPQHWEVLKLKRVIAGVESGTSVNATDEPASDEQIGVLKTSSVYTGKFDPNENKVVVESELDRVCCPLRLNTIIVSRMNTPDLVGAAGLVREAPANVFLPDRLWQVSFHDCEPTFVYLWTLSNLYRGQIKSVCTGTSASMKNLTQDQFGSLVFCCPPVPEQQTIAECVEREIQTLEQLEAEAERAIEILQERRTALISAAVTGKIDVREFACQETA